MHRGKATTRMTKYDVLRWLRTREYWYSINSRGCLVEVIQLHIEVEDVLVDVVCFVLLNTYGFICFNICCGNTLQAPAL